MEPSPKFEAPPLVAAAEQPPQFKKPKTEATSEPAPRFSKPKTDVKNYAAALAAVESGQTVILSVGTAPQPADYYEESHAQILPGRYRCWKDKTGNPKMALVATPDLAPLKQQPLVIQQK